METKVTNEEPSDTTIDLSEALILNGMNLDRKPKYGLNAKEHFFKDEGVFEEIVCRNCKILFGEYTYITDARAHDLPFHLLIDFNDLDLPVVYFLNIYQSAMSGDTLNRITKILMFLNNRDSEVLLLNFICAMVNEDATLKMELEARIEGGDVIKHLQEAVIRRSYVLLVTDDESDEVRQIVETYYEWRSVKQLLLKTYEDSGATLCIMLPNFSDLGKEKLKKRESKSEKPKKQTEEDHLAGVSDEAREVYEKIKASLLQSDGSVEFNPKALYISIRKGKNLAFVQIGKKKITLVVSHPEEDTRKQIKHHEIKTLTPKVQQFWNGNGPACSIVIENEDKLNEVTSLLKKMIKAQE